MNISEKMDELVARVKRHGFNGSRVPLSPERKDAWNENYAAVTGYYFEHSLDREDDEYFDRRGFRRDFEKLVREFFGDGTVEVKFYDEAQEIEVYRK